ncbi:MULTISPECIES: hypothetical protein [unclassified Rhizobium]|uniref:hypothetical protein n=1 Tax=unclassified Rhizobium TaxID=2613769 RepID=UPI001ADA6F00|nr:MULTISPECIES: hypothetical protein [unclassified Rhizobium]MBO9096846.1 hypothetical protein [Rhizobium sp. L58/93]QXZ87361.1 hypothetical protein J5287_22745 [Rhizobium sp. K1/93]QXZ92607.1 hypothetical protein J5280_26445 [Rhizobium sp. K15/93]QYA04171.1 hypothetical protein J5278_25900 [Rhizobium sp. B21/90]
MVTMAFQFLGLPYLLGFAALAFWRRWWLLAPAVVAAFIFARVQFEDLSHGDGPGLVGGLALMLFLTVGMASGALASAIVIVGSRFRARRLRSPVVLPLVAVLGFGSPFLYWAYGAHVREARRAPPPSACMTGLHRVSLASRAFDIPVSPVIGLMQAGGARKYFSLGYFQSAREFCDATAAGLLALDSLNVNLDGYPGRRPAQTDNAFCEVEHPTYLWAQTACHPITSADVPEMPTTVTLQLRNPKYDISQNIEAHRKSRPLTMLADGTKRYGDDKTFDLERVDGFFAFCTRPGTPSQQYIACTSYKNLDTQVLLSYNFRTTDADLLNRADAVERNALAVLDSLSAGSRE